MFPQLTNIDSAENDGRKHFAYETKASIYLSQQGEWVYDSQSWKKKRLLPKSVFVPIDKQTLTPKNGEKRSFS